MMNNKQQNGESMDHLNQIFLSPPRPQITQLDLLPFPDRSFLDYEKYNNYNGHAMVKNKVALLTTRGCPYGCAYCHKIWPKTHMIRSAENIMEEVKLYYDIGITNFSITDDIFNFNAKNSIRFFEYVLKEKMDVRFFFPNGLRGDILTRSYIDLMVEAGTILVDLALETASPRLQKLIGKRMNIEKLQRNLEYFCNNYPQVILNLNVMHGFPTETKEEAQASIDFIKSLKWLHFPYFNLLKIYPGTEMERVALENGVSAKAIADSIKMTFHELPETLPFEKSFTFEPIKSKPDNFELYNQVKIPWHPRFLLFLTVCR